MRKSDQYSLRPCSWPRVMAPEGQTHCSSSSHTCLSDRLHTNIRPHCLIAQCMCAIAASCGFLGRRVIMSDAPRTMARILMVNLAPTIGGIDCSVSAQELANTEPMCPGHLLPMCCQTCGRNEPAYLVLHHIWFSVAMRCK